MTALDYSLQIQREVEAICNFWRIQCFPLQQEKREANFKELHHLFGNRFDSFNSSIKSTPLGSAKVVSDLNKAFKTIKESWIRPSEPKFEKRSIDEMNSAIDSLRKEVLSKPVKVHSLDKPTENQNLLELIDNILTFETREWQDFLSSGKPIPNLQKIHANFQKITNSLPDEQQLSLFNEISELNASFSEAVNTPVKDPNRILTGLEALRKALKPKLIASKEELKVEAPEKKSQSISLANFQKSVDIAIQSLQLTVNAFKEIPDDSPEKIKAIQLIQKLFDASKTLKSQERTTPIKA
jgi:hypothetical protein